jgi:hypothetical protein
MLRPAIGEHEQLNHHRHPEQPQSREARGQSNDGKIALITGGNSGIGLATAKQFVSEGAYVFITARREPELAVAVKDIGQTETGSWNHARETAGNVERGSFRISLESYTQIISKSPGLCEIPATVFRITVP